MDKIIYLYNELYNKGIKVYNYEVAFAKATTLEVNRRYAIFIDNAQIKTSAEERHIILHESGHALTGATHKVYSPFELMGKNEERANRWAYRRWMSEEDIRKALHSGYTEIWELAEYFDITEDFVRGALKYYIEACGINFNDFEVG